MIKYEDMPESAQKAYRITNMARKVVLFIGWILIIWMAVICIYNAIMQLGVTDGILTVGIMVPFYFLIHGWFHFEFLHRYLSARFGIISILLMMIILAICNVFLVLFTIVDTILIFLKKPLIYPFENKYFL